MRRLAVVVLVGLGIMALAACGGDDSGSPLGADTDIPEDVQDEIDDQLEDLDEDLEGLGNDGEACSLLTVSEIEDEVGNSVEEGIETVGICTWASGAAETNVSVSLVDLPSPSACQDAWGNDPAYSELDGLDDPAYTSSNDLAGIPQADVIVCGDPTQLGVTVTGGYDDTQSTDDIQEQAEALTQIAAGRL